MRLWRISDGERPETRRETTKGAPQSDHQDRRTYFEYIRSELAIVEPPNTPHLRETIDSILERKDLDALDWHDVYRAERALLDALPMSGLQQKAWDIRARFLGVAPAELRKLIPREPAEESALRAHLGVLLQETYWHYCAKMSWERQREWFSRKFRDALIIIALVVAVPPVVSAFTSHVLFRAPSPRDWSWLKTTYVLVMTASIGAMGGFVSLLQRLKNSPGSYTDELLELQHAHTSVLCQAVSLGGIFALVLLAMFEGGIVSGAVFPSAPTGDISFTRLGAALYDSAAELTKVMFWSFVAGFAERLVPDMIDRVTKSSKVTVLVPPGGAAT
jgi:hypothetical protein